MQIIYGRVIITHVYIHLAFKELNGRRASDQVTDLWFVH